jgi:peptidoglycan LD-endopeptidase LytH
MGDGPLSVSLILMHQFFPSVVEAMKLSTVVLVAITLAGCSSYAAHPGIKARGVGGARDRYETEILNSDLAESAAYRGWVAEGRRALRDGLSIRPSFREVIEFSSSDAAAVGYRLDLRRGQRLRVRLDRETFRGRLFGEVFEEIGGQDAIFRLVESASGQAAEFSFEARADGVHIVRIQPELDRGGKVAITLGTVAGLTFPVEGKTSRAIGSVFGDSRDGGARSHEGIDIFAARGTTVKAVADGVIMKVNTTNIGGRVVWQYDSQRDVEYYYAHLNSQSVKPGQRVTAGTEIGTVGNTGNARTTPPHLHFAVYRPGRVAINPVPFIYDAPGNPVEPVLVDLRRLGDWTETRRASTLHASPASGAPMLAKLPANTRVLVMSGVRDWHRVQLEDGRRGFMPGQPNLLGMQ